ncbi:MAG: DUF302 domain-containing protein [Trichloromonas sp.]|jgi:uncharacterized protein (DUF302 family)|nr:DUF302 domain-containing protein [Trichloromonas sp.]
MNPAEIYRAQSKKTLDSFVADFEKAAVKSGFSIHNRDNMAMADIYREKNHPMPEDFDLHMIQICKPEKSSQSFQHNIERAPLMPKFVMAFSKDGATEVRFLYYSKELIAALIPGDAAFPVSLEQTYGAIRTMIEEAL